MLIELDFKNTEDYKDKEVNIKNEKFTVLIDNMMESYKNNKPLPNSGVISKDSEQQVFFSDYPIEALNIEFYIPAKESNGASVAAGITS